jgi:hypothetical protein
MPKLKPYDQYKPDEVAYEPDEYDNISEFYRNHTPDGHKIPIYHEFGEEYREGQEFWDPSDPKIRWKIEKDPFDKTKLRKVKIN